MVGTIIRLKIALENLRSGVSAPRISETIGLLRDETLINDTQPFVSEGFQTAQGKCLLWLGSSVSNLTPPNAVMDTRSKEHNDKLLVCRLGAVIALHRACGSAHTVSYCMLCKENEETNVCTFSLGRGTRKSFFQSF